MTIAQSVVTVQVATGDCEVVSSAAVDDAAAATNLLAPTKSSSTLTFGSGHFSKSSANSAASSLNLPSSVPSISA